MNPAPQSPDLRSPYYRALDAASADNARFFVDGHAERFRATWNLVHKSSVQLDEQLNAAKACAAALDKLIGGVTEDEVRAESVRMGGYYSLGVISDVVVLEAIAVLTNARKAGLLDT